jgi:serine-type D-Ala-D-Ala carboxypeptidase/endopeptidase (penicillin-binding protein 4)
MGHGRFRIVVVPLALALGGVAVPTAAGQSTAKSANEGARVQTPLARPSVATARPVPVADPWPARIAARLAALQTRTVAHAGAAAVDRPHGAPRLDPALATDLAGIAAAAGPRTKIGITVRALDSGATLFDRQGDEALNPASNQKLLTAIAALELLGADYRFATQVRIDGDALVLVGHGDPSLLPEHLHALAQRVATTPGLPAIRRVIVDDTAFTPERFGPGYDPEGPGYSYMAPSGALSLQWNTVAITVTPTHAGAPVEVTTLPPCAHLDVVVQATTGRGAPLEVETHAHGARTRIVVRGTVSRREGTQEIRRRIADPGLFAGTVFARALAENGMVEHGMTEPEVVRGSASPTATLVAEHESAPLRDVLHSALKYSNNFTTEQILRTLGHRLTGEPGDWTNGGEALARFWRALGRDPQEIVFENAAGYSRRGRMSARALVDLLQLATAEGSPGHGLFAALAVAGKDGTLRDRLHDADGRVLAKTGSLSGTSALTGVIVDDAGTPKLGFSILLNGAVDRKRGAQLQDRIVRALLAHG